MLKATATPALHNLLASNVLQHRPFLVAKRAVSDCETTRLASQNEPNGNAERHMPQTGGGHSTF
jgi:hypothetical protein